jgi:hypothetical protein
VSLPADLQPADWAVVQIHQPAGRMIQAMQMTMPGCTPRWSKWVHAIYCVAIDPIIIVEATPQGTKKVPFHYDLADVFWSSGVIAKNAATRERSVHAALASTEANNGQGIGYSFLDYLAQADHAWHIPFPGLQDYIADTGHSICSQDVDQFELDGGTHLFTDERWAGYVAPWMLAKRIGAP